MSCANKVAVVTECQGRHLLRPKGTAPRGPGQHDRNIGSTASIQPGAGLSIYGGTKAALRAMIRGWVMDIKGSGVRINILSPGPADTASLQSFFGDHAEEAIAYLNSRSTIGRIGRPGEIARAVAFLGSDAASYINGTEIFAGGGASQV